MVSQFEQEQRLASTYSASVKYKDEDVSVLRCAFCSATSESAIRSSLSRGKILNLFGDWWLLTSIVSEV